MRGHIRRRGSNGRWAVVVDVGHAENGRRKQRWHSGFGTKRDASRALTEILNRLALGEYIEPSRQNLAAFLREWLDAARTTLRPGTWQSYKTNVDAYIVPRLGMTPLQSLTPAMLTAFYGDLLRGGRRSREGGLSPRTVRFTHQILRKALSEAVRWGRLARNPADQATPPRQNTPEMKTWSAGELRRFLEHVEGDRLYAAWLLAATTGLRRGELLGLRWKDVDLEAGRLSVTQALLSVRNRLSVSPPKTAKSRRSVALDARTVAALQAHRKAQLEERLAFGGDWPDHDLVFTREDGEPIHPDRFSRDWFRQYVRAAGLPLIRFHDLRHTHATLALQAGIHPKVVSERLGHATVSITLDTYSHAIPALQEEAAAKVAAVVFGR